MQNICLYISFILACKTDLPTDKLNILYLTKENLTLLFIHSMEKLSGHILRMIHQIVTSVL